MFNLGLENPQKNKTVVERDSFVERGLGEAV